MKGRLGRALPHALMLLVSALLYWAALQIDTRGAEGGRRIGPEFWPKLVIAIMAGLCLFEIVRRLLAKAPGVAGAALADAPPGAVPAALAVPALPDSHSAAVALADDPPGDPPADPPGDAPCASQAAPASAPARTYPGRLLAGMAAIGGFALAVDWLGFFAATAAFLAAFMLIGGMRRPLLAAAIGLAGSFALIVVFMRVAYISLPLGAGPFRELSLALLRVLGVT